jgi:hypothetical protein
MRDHLAQPIRGLNIWANAYHLSRPETSILYILEENGLRRLQGARKPVNDRAAYHVCRGSCSLCYSNNWIGLGFYLACWLQKVPAKECWMDR